MSNEAIFVTQLVAWLTYVGIAFWLYRLLANQKDAHIALLKEQLAIAKENSAETLLLRLQATSSAAKDEIERMANDHSTTKEALAEKNAELTQLKQQVSALEYAMRLASGHFGVFTFTEFVGNSPTTPLPMRK